MTQSGEDRQLGLEVGSEVVRILAQAHTLEEATPELLACIGEAFDWQTGAIWEVEPGAGMLRCLGTWHLSGLDVTSFHELTETIEFAPGVGLPGRVWATEEPAVIHDITTEKNFPRAQAAAKSG